ncbi:TPA: hypothetical protein ACG3RW_003779 [Clostridioides difficile]|jgi:hypothetical protein
MKKTIKLYNLIFPIWFLLFFPPVILLTLAGNFIIDSLVIIACFFVYKLANSGLELKTFYKGSILKTWLYGFLADFIGASILFLLGLCGDTLGLSYELTSAICYDPFSHPLAVIIILGAILVSAIFVFFFNYKYSFKKLIEEKALRFKIALILAIITAPWTFLLPTKWFYY